MFIFCTNLRLAVLQFLEPYMYLYLLLMSYQMKYFTTVFQTVSGVRIVPVPLLPILQLRGPSLPQLGRPRGRAARHRGLPERGGRPVSVTAADIPSDLKDDVMMRLSRFTKGDGLVSPNSRGL